MEGWPTGSLGRLEGYPSSAGGSAPPGGDSERLKPYVPRLLIEWLRRSPGTSYQARDGSLAFVDISGFVTLTERLARRGRIGPELLRDILDGVLGAVLDEAYTWGAGLLKWGGDALLVFFDRPGHPERSARAAWEMQRTIRSQAAHAPQVPHGDLLFPGSARFAS